MINGERILIRVVIILIVEFAASCDKKRKINEMVDLQFYNSKIDDIPEFVALYGMK